MGLLSKIANSRLGRGGAIATAVGSSFVPTYEMLNPPAVYAQVKGGEVKYDKIKAEELVDKLATMTKPSIEVSPEIERHYYIQGAKMLIEGFIMEAKYGPAFETLPDGSQRMREAYLDGSIGPKDICSAVNLLYNIAQGKFGGKLATIAQQNLALGELVQKYQKCSR